MKKIIRIGQGEHFDLYFLEEKIAQALQEEGLIGGEESYRFANKDFTLIFEVVEEI